MWSLYCRWCQLKSVNMLTIIISQSTKWLSPTRRTTSGIRLKQTNQRPIVFLKGRQGLWTTSWSPVILNPHRKSLCRQMQPSYKGRSLYTYVREATARRQTMSCSNQTPASLFAVQLYFGLNPGSAVVYTWTKRPGQQWGKPTLDVTILYNIILTELTVVLQHRKIECYRVPQSA